MIFPLELGKEAVIVLLPTERPVAIPRLPLVFPIFTWEVEPDVQLTKSVISCLLPSE